MILISHRGNIDGPILDKENSPDYIHKAIELGYDVEIDMWLINDKIYLGHDEPQYEINYKWLNDKINKLWIHCKNIELLSWIKHTQLHYFWHENDKMTLTSKNYIWVYPGNQPLMGSISVMPEIHKEDTTQCVGICSDYIKNYK